MYRDVKSGNIPQSLVVNFLFIEMKIHVDIRTQVELKLYWICVETDTKG